MITAADIQNLIQPLLEAERYKLCEVRLGSARRRPLIQIFVDVEEGFITIDQCAEISRLVQDILDLQDWAPGDYRLEVSSPGITSPLREIWQFRKNRGQLIRRVDALGIELAGRIVDVAEDGHIQLHLEDRVEAYALNELAGARVALEPPRKQEKPKRKRNETRGR